MKQPTQGNKNKQPSPTRAKQAEPKKAASGGLSAKIKTFNFKLRKQKLKYGTLATALTALLIAAVILINVLIGFLTDEYNIKFDMTSDKRFQISDMTKDVLDKLEEVVKVYIISSEQDFRARTYGDEMAEVLHRYETYSDGMVDVVYVDPVRNPGFIDQYSSLSNVAIGSMIVERGDRARAFKIDSLYYTSNSTIVGIYIETRLTSAISYIDLDEKPMAVFLSGHGEYDEVIAQFLALMGEIYDTRLLDIRYHDIPEETDILFLCSPTSDFNETDIIKLEKYLGTYKHFVYLTNGDVHKLPELEMLFYEHGVVFDDAVVCDDIYRHGNSYTSVATQTAVSNSPFTNALSKGVIMPYSKAMRQTKTEVDFETTSQVLLRTSSNAYAKVKDAGKPITSFEKEDGDIEGPFDAAILLTKTNYINNEAVVSYRLFLSGASLFHADIINDEAFDNMNFASNVFNTIDTRSIYVKIRGKNFTDMPTLEIVGNERTVVLAVLCLIPAAILVAGLSVWNWRKNK